MKICFIAPKAYQLFNPKVKSTFGGAEVQLFLLATELAQRHDLDIHFMVADYNQSFIENYHNVNIWKAINFKNNFILQSFTFFKVFNKINADIYIQRTLTLQSGLIALYCKLKRKKFIYMVAHDSEVDGTHKLYRNKITNFLAKINFKFAHKIVVQNNYQNEKLLAQKFNPHIVKSSYPIEKNFKKPNYPKILWVGRSEPWKRPELFLEIAKLFPLEKFIMICAPSTDTPELAKKIKAESTHIKNLEFIEFVPFKDINQYFLNAKIYINTSVKEGFPNTFIQATKNRTPILSLNVNPDNFIVEYDCGFFCNNNLNTMIKNIQNILINPMLYNRLAQNAYQYAIKNHDITVNANKFIDIITK